YSNASYSFNDLYLLTVSMRKDASNLFGVKTNQKGTPLWSIGAGWKISNEKFYKLSAIPYLNLRATYGYSGNVNNTLSALTTIGSNPTYFPNIPVTRVMNYPNLRLRWEKVEQLNIGADFRTKYDRISGSIEYYRKKSTDVLALQLLDPTVGTSSAYV